MTLCPLRLAGAGVEIEEMGARVSVSGTVVIAACGAMALALFAPLAHAQTASAPSNPGAVQAPSQPPGPRFVSSYAILRTARAAGFQPLAPPLRDGPVYVLRATDFRGILMRVVLDARTGAIRDVNRIVAAGSDAYERMPPYGAPPYAPAPYAPPPYEVPAYAPPPYAPPPYEPPPYGTPAEYDAPAPPMPPPDQRPPVRLTRPHPAAARSSLPPLPRPRPAALVAQKSNKAATPPEPGLAQSTGIKAGTAAGEAAAPSKTAPPAPLND